MSEDDRVDSEDSLLATAKRAIGLVDAHGSIQSPVPRVNRPTRNMDESLVELMVENIAAGYVVPPCYLARPSHLPDEEKEMRSLALSKADRDQQLKSDMMEWVSINRRVCSQGATTLRNAIVAIRLANDLLNEGDQNDDRIHEMMTKIQDHVLRTYRLDVREAPAGLGELGVWCELKLAEYSPVPEWLRDGKIAAAPLFAPQKKPGQTMRLLQGGAATETRRHGRDDDD